jgi:F-type H+-transporting ATPase subunit gamma
MAGLKEIRNRITSVKSTQQITRAMKMVAAAKLRRAQDKIIKMRPYSGKLRDILLNLSDNTDGNIRNPFYETREVKKVLLVPISADRGLCGSFNSTVNKLTYHCINSKLKNMHPSLEKVESLAVGKKVVDYLKKNNYETVATHSNFFSNLSWEAAEEISEWILNAFTEKKYDAVYLIYNQFKNAVVYNTVLEPYLPIKDELEEMDKNVAAEKNNAKQNNDYIFEPNRQQIMEDLIPKSLKVSFFSALLDSNASENGARMTAMDHATDNAEDILRALRIKFNKERQASITTEILEIVSGARALENA